jgi:hypothetical protein
MIANKKGSIIYEFDQSSYELFLLKGKIIYEYEKRTKQVLTTIERHFNIRLKQLVCDFQKDDKNRVWLIGIHSYLVETDFKVSKKMLKFNGEDTI